MNARDDTALMADITRQGLDIDQGMVVKLDGVSALRPGSIHALSLMSGAAGGF